MFLLPGLMSLFIFITNGIGKCSPPEELSHEMSAFRQGRRKFSCNVLCLLLTPPWSTGKMVPSVPISLMAPAAPDHDSIIWEPVVGTTFQFLIREVVLKQDCVSSVLSSTSRWWRYCTIYLPFSSLHIRSGWEYSDSHSLVWFDVDGGEDLGAEPKTVVFLPLYFYHPCPSPS